MKEHGQVVEWPLRFGEGVGLTQLRWCSDSRGQEGARLRPDTEQWGLLERSQRLLWTMKVRGAVLVEGA